MYPDENKIGVWYVPCVVLGYIHASPLMPLVSGLTSVQWPNKQQ